MENRGDGNQQDGGNDHSRLARSAGGRGGSPREPNMRPAGAERQGSGWQVLTSKSIRQRFGRRSSWGGTVGWLAALAAAVALLALPVAPMSAQPAATLPQVVSAGPSTQSSIALVFDGGPSALTLDYLRELHRLFVPATFFF